ncbi:sigma-70 family RNA polymerase sigma factor [Corticibacter populi]|uniref:Sigma-70 family RNA polymerase sigma factor n=1 Tax=Corticibacter populi TaxID=1550736 RepID=A0A3M6QK34_9BURK|nr:sigma-70 family RNA polymerase sigma factor [Corticibacter populi]RMX03464.1 sigma-70 family RNA polymerase sigma factor [Corticibacter populi]RZS29902.1 RNA polymerase sigma-70 factor (ECF subfamily) [Corticibacter populi]
MFDSLSDRASPGWGAHTPHRQIAKPSVESRRGDAAGTDASADTWLGIDIHWLYGTLLQALLKKTQCPHQAGDVLHDALIRYASTAMRKPVGQPHAYLWRVAESALIDQHRRARRFVPLPELQEGEDGCASELQDTAQPSMETLMHLRQRLEHLQKLFDCLPPRCRETFWMLRVEGYSQAEIAERLGISIKTVEGHVARALLQLVAWREAHRDALP